jgi:hypothetical protein
MKSIQKSNATRAILRFFVCSKRGTIRRKNPIINIMFMRVRITGLFSKKNNEIKTRRIVTVAIKNNE